MTASEQLLADLDARDSVRGREYMGWEAVPERGPDGEPSRMVYRAVYFYWPMDRCCGDDE